nr:hypothetical protein [uncultured Flavobacterium sp.]
MTDFDKILWGFIFSAVGISFGWTLNQLGQWFNSRREDKKNLKVVLFNLLETYFIFVRSDLNKYVQKVTDKVHSQIPADEQTYELKIFLNKFYLDIFSNHFKPNLEDEIKIVRENYQTCIKTLATIDPLTAYYLSGKENIIDGFDKMETLFDKARLELGEDSNNMHMEASQVLNIVKTNIFESALVDLEKDIVKISLKINPYVWFKSKKAIERLKHNADVGLDKEIDNLFDKLNAELEGR